MLRKKPRQVRMSWTRWLTHGASQNSGQQQAEGHGLPQRHDRRGAPLARGALALPAVGGYGVGFVNAFSARGRPDSQNFPRARIASPVFAGVVTLAGEPPRVDEPSPVRGTGVDAEDLRLAEDLAMAGVRHRLRRRARPHRQLVALGRDHVHAEGAGLVEAVPAVERARAVLLGPSAGEGLVEGHVRAQRRAQPFQALDRRRRPLGPGHGEELPSLARASRSPAGPGSGRAARGRC